MFFSVLIPVYNVEKYLHQCIDSVLGQSEQDFEIILVNDGSTDSSGKICDEYKQQHPHIIHVIHKENEGLLLTRRCAIKASKGDWIVHLDSDDYMLPGALGNIRKAAMETDADLVLYNIIYGQKDINDFSHKSILPFTNGEIFDRHNKMKLYRQFVLKGYITSIFQKAAKRTIVDVNQNYKKLHFVSLMEDHLQSLPLFNNFKKAVFLDKEFIYYRYNINSITKQKTLSSYIDSFYSCLAVYKEECRYCTMWGFTTQEKALACAKHMRKLSLLIGNMAKIINDSNKALFYNFILKLRSNPSWLAEIKNADRKALGKVALIGGFLIKNTHPNVVLKYYKVINSK